VLDALDREGERTASGPTAGAGRPAAGGSTPPPGQPPRRLTVDLGRKTITLDGKPYDVSSDNALRRVGVLAHHPGARVRGTGLEKYDSELQNRRTDRWRNHLPDEILSLIDSVTGKGSRIRL